MPGLRRQPAAARGAGRDLRGPHDRRAGRAAADRAGRACCSPRAAQRHGPGAHRRPAGPGSSRSRELGLGYLSLDRATPTLSAGELQRLRLATQLRSGLFGVVYVLDEPSAGLHPADTEALLAVLDRLKEAGNSVFVVEHQLDVVRQADWLVDVGPLAGEHGGRVLHSGPPAGLADVAESATALPLRRAPGPGAAACARPSRVAPARPGSTGTTCAASTPTSRSGCSPPSPGCRDRGSPRWSARSERGARPGVGRLVAVDQKPIGRTPRSNLATYTGLFDVVRKLFAATAEARERGLPGRAGSPSTWRADGARPARARASSPWSCSSCPARTRPARTATAPATTRRRWRSRYRGLTIAEVLDLTVEAAAGFFAGTPGGRAQSAGAARRGPRLSAARAAGHGAVGRRGPADQAGDRAAAHPPRPHPVPPRRADDRPASGRRRGADAAVARAGGRRRTRWWSWSTTWRWWRAPTG